MKTLRQFFRITHPNLRDLMTGLYYPAVLGAGIVFLLLLVSHSMSWRETASDFRFYFGLLFSLFFSYSYFTILQEKPERYNLGTFFCDLVESILIFFAFGSLGLYEPRPAEPDIPTTYWLFFWVIVVENIWTWIIGRFEPAKLVLSLCAWVVLVLSATILYQWESGNAAALLVLYILFAIDVSYLFRASKKKE